MPSWWMPASWQMHCADDCLVSLHLQASDVRQQPAGGDRRVVRMVVVRVVKVGAVAWPSRLLRASIAGPLADAVIVHSIAPRRFRQPPGCWRRPGQSLWQCTLITARSMFGTRLTRFLMTPAKCDGVA